MRKIASATKPNFITLIGKWLKEYSKRTIYPLRLHIRYVYNANDYELYYHVKQTTAIIKLWNPSARFHTISVFNLIVMASWR